MVEPMFEVMVTPSKSNEKPSEGCHSTLFLTLLNIVEHRSRKSTDHKRKYFLEGDHYLKSYNSNKLTIFIIMDEHKEGYMI